MSGLSRTPGKRVQDNILTGVRIPLSPPDSQETRPCDGFLFGSRAPQGLFLDPVILHVELSGRCAPIAARFLSRPEWGSSLSSYFPLETKQTRRPGQRY